MASRRPNLPGSNIKRIYRHSTHIIHSETNFQERTLSYCRWLYMTLRPKTKGALLLLADQFFLCSDLLTISAMCKVVKIVNTILECLTLPTTFYLAYMNVRVNVTSDLSFLLNTTPFWCKNHFCGLKTEGVTNIFLTKNIFPMLSRGVADCALFCVTVSSATFNIPEYSHNDWGGELL